MSCPNAVSQEEDAGDFHWTCCMKGGQWRVELDAASKTARLWNPVRHVGVYGSEVKLYAAMKRFLGQKIGWDGRQKPGIGLVLAGGGAKGAYQIGAWDVLRQLGLDKEVRGIAGTSIGAVNTLLFARGDFNYAKELWESFSEPRFRREQREQLKQYQAKYSKKKFQKWQKLGLKIVGTGDFLSQAELERALNQAVAGQAERICSRYYVFSTMTGQENNEWSKTVYVPWNVLSAHEMATAALASAAMPVLYQNVKFRGKPYLDGGWVGPLANAPVEPLYQCGFRKFIVIHLEREGKHVGDVREKIEAYGGCQAVHIVPPPEFGDDFCNMLTLTPEAIQKRMEMGRKSTLELAEQLTSLAEL